MPAFDANLMTRTTGNLTTTESGSGVILRGTGVKGMAARAAVPTAYNDNDTLIMKVWVSNDNTTYYLHAQSDTLKTFKTNPRDVIVALVTDHKYAKIQLVPSSTTAANINFGVVKAGFVTGVGYDWDRSLGFE
jgi:hypothetical protein